MTHSQIYEVTDTLVDIKIAQLKTRSDGVVFGSDLDAYAFAEKAFVVVHEHCDSSDASTWFSMEVARHGSPAHRAIHLLRLQQPFNAPSYQLMLCVGEPYSELERMKSNSTVKLVLTPADTKVRTTQRL